MADDYPECELSNKDNDSMVELIQEEESHHENDRSPGILQIKAIDNYSSMVSLPANERRDIKKSQVPPYWYYILLLH